MAPGVLHMLALHHLPKRSILAHAQLPLHLHAEIDSMPLEMDLQGGASNQHDIANLDLFHPARVKQDHLTACRKVLLAFSLDELPSTLG